MRARALLSALVGVLVFASPTHAISNGTLDGNGHPNVGAFRIEVGGQKFLICSGSLISPTVFLTAAHCLEFLPSLGVTPSDVEVTFSSDTLSPAATWITATDYQFDPGFGHDFADLHDLGVIKLPAGSTAGITPAALPPAGWLDDAAAQGGLRDMSFVNVGYGVHPSWKGGPPQFTFDGQRWTSTSPFMALTQSWLFLLMNNDATGEGGVCFGDSGSPHFAPGTNMIVATTTGGDPICRALNYDYRLDTLSARSFLGQFVALP